MGECHGEEAVGRVVGDSTPQYSYAALEGPLVKARGIVAGVHVVASSPEGCVLGVIESIVSQTRVFEPLANAAAIDNVAEAIAPSIEEYRLLKAKIRWLTKLETVMKAGVIDSPKAPVEPGSRVYLALPEVLETIFAPRATGWIRMGSLLGSGVEYRVNVNALSRHLAILAVTGGGKSNTVCILAKSIVGELGGTVLLFDVHGEYGDLGLAGKAKIWSPASVNPASITFNELLELIRMPPHATQQERILRWVWEEVRGLMFRGAIGARDLIPSLTSVLEAALALGDLRKGFIKALGVNPEKQPPPSDRDKVSGILSKLDDLSYYYSEAIDASTPLMLESVIVPGKLNVMDLSSLDETAMDAVVSHYLRRLLASRKEYKTKGSGYPVPVIVVLEEAHTLIPGDGDTLTKYWAARIAREGRKFGLGLVLVSQRPKKLDSDVLSQANNKIILRMVEPQDIRYVQAASEELSEDLATLLPSLNRGEAVVLGGMARMPAVVKIDLCDAKKAGGDIDLVGEWRASAAREPGEGDVEDLASELGI